MKIDVGCLVFWNDDWFAGRTLLNSSNPKHRFILSAANDKKYETMGFFQSSSLQHYQCYFGRDPGFKYFPVIKFRGKEVSFNGIRADASPREVLIGWGDYTSEPPDPENWRGSWSGQGNGPHRYVRIEDLEKIEGTVPDWSLPG